MRKNNPGIMDDSRKPRRRRVSAVLTIVLGLLVSPLVYEGTLLCVVQWKMMYGPVETAKTPVLDYLAESYNQGSKDLGEILTPVFRTVPWKPAVVIPFAIAWTGLAALMLRRC